MAWQHTPYTFPLIMVGAFCCLLALHIHRSRLNKEAVIISLLMFTIGLWSLTYALQLASGNLRGQLFWNRLQYLPVVLIPVIWFVLGLQYSGRERLLIKKNVLSLLIIPMITFALVWTNHFHRLIWKDFRLEDIGPFVVESSVRGVWNWIHIAYSYLLVLLGSLLILERLINSKAPLYRAQAVILLFFASAPWAGNILFIFGIHPFPYLNITPFIFALTCPVLAWSLFRFHLADLSPVTYGAIIENLNDGVIVLDRRNRIVEINPAAQAFLNVTASRSIGSLLEPLVPDFARQLGQLDFIERLEQEITLNGSGRQRVYDVHISPLLDGRGQAHSRIAVMRDISERKLAEAELQLHRDHLEEKVERRTAELSEMNAQLINEITQRARVEKALRESENRYKGIVENSNDIIMLTGPDGIIRYLSPSCRKIVGYEPEELMGTKQWLVHPNDLAAVKEKFPRAFAGESAVNFEYRITAKNGDTKWVSHSWSPILDGSRLQLVASSIRDITERKVFEEALRRSEERYRMLVDNSLSAILVSQDGLLKFANKKLIQISGYSQEELLNAPFDRLVHPEDRRLVAEIIQRRYSGEDLQSHYEYRGVTKTGDTIWLESFGTIIEYQGRNALLVHLNDITDRKKAEDALKKSEQLYRSLVEEAKDIIYTIDLKNNTISGANSFAEEILGYSREDVIGCDYLTMVAPDDRAHVIQAFHERLSGEERRPNFPLRMRKSDGTFLDVEQNAAVLFDEKGTPATFLGIARDVTERKRMEEELRQSEERYRSLVDHSGTGVFVLQDGVFKFVNKRLCEMSGYSLDEIMRLPLEKVIHPDDKEVIWNIVSERISGETPRGHSQFRTIIKNGDVRWVETYGARIQFQGRPALMVNLLDITERRQMEEALRESEQKYRSLVELTSDWVWETDREGNYTYASPKVKDLLGYEPEEVVGRHVLEFMIMIPEDIERTRRYFTRKALNKESFAGIENENRHKNGRVVVLESSGVPFCDSAGNLLGYRGMDRDITQRKRADEALRISEERYRSVFEEAPDIFYILDLETGIIVDANKYALQSLGYGPEAIGKTKFLNILHPEDFERASASMKRMVATKEKMPDFPLRIITSTGELRHIEQRGVLLYENDKPKYLLGLAHDVTERKLQETMIHKRNEKLAALYEVAKAANASLDLEVMFKLIIDVVLNVTRSDAACIYEYDENLQSLSYRALVGLPDELVKGTDHLKLGQGLHGHVALAKAPLLAHSLPSHPLPETRPHFSQFGFDSILIVPLLARDKLLGTLTVVRKPGKPYDSEDLDLMTAIANQIVVAMENANLYSRILQRETHLQSILQTSMDGVVVTTVDQKVSYRNAALSAMFGYDENDDISDTDTINYFAPESYPVLFWLREKLSRREPIDRMVEFRGRRKNGSVFDAEMRIGHFLENGRRLDVGIIRDVTERKRMQSQLLQSSKLAAIGELAAGVAHEINNPISAIDMQSGLMRDILNDESDSLNHPLFCQLENYLDTIEDQVRRCHLVTDNLLSFSRFPEIKSEWFDINQLVSRTVQFLANLSDKKPRVETRLDPKLPSFYGDPNRLEQVFVNLFSNALKAIDKNGSIIISTGLEDNGDIRIEFKDSGMGIPADIKDRIFDPFFTTRPEGEGTGLGLSICHYIIREMKGAISFESSAGAGTTFTITLEGASA